MSIHNPTTNSWSEVVHLLGYVKNREKQRQAFTIRGKTPNGRFKVIMLSV